MTTFSQKSFSGGEISPSLYARVDQVKYANGLKTCRNSMVMRHGGTTNRPGTVFVAEVKDSSKTVRFIPFIFNSDQTYVLEFGDQYMRVIRNGAQVVESAKTISGATQANPCVVTASAHGYSNGEEVYISGVAGMTQLNGRNFKVANVATNTFELKYMDGTNVNSTAFSAYSSGGNSYRVYTISTPYVEADLATLQFTQSADVITIVHKTYAPRELSRTGHTSWTLSTITFGPLIAAPTSLTNNGTGGPYTLGTRVARYVVTAISSSDSEESLQATETNTSTIASSGTTVKVSWTNSSGASEYNVYKCFDRAGSFGTIFGFIGTSEGSSFVDDGIDPDLTNRPPLNRSVFASSGNYPSAVSYYQQRLGFANSTNDPEKFWASRSSYFKNFTTSTPLQDDDSVIFSIVGKQVNEVRHIVELGRLLLFTSGGEWIINGNGSGILTPSDVNPSQQSAYGSSYISPLIVGSNVLYVQARKTIIRDLVFDLQVDGYRGNDLTIFSSHLFDQYEILDWAYQQIPNSIVWVVRDDGNLIGLTYVREHEMVAWHRHDFDGTVENVCVVPEGNEDALYLTIKRTINSSTKRYIERMATRQVSDIVDSIFMDCALSYDGRNTNTGHTMTLSGGTDWTYTETLTLTSSASFFVSTDVGNQIFLTGSDGTLIRFTIAGYTSGTVVTGSAHKTVPVAMRSAAISEWSRAVDSVSGLWHLEGKSVSVVGDGFVVANPNNSSYSEISVSSGAITLDKPYTVIHVGLPYISDIETLNIDTVQGETMADKKKMVSKVSVFVESSRGLFAGSQAPSDDSVDPLEGLYEYKLRNDEGYDDPVELKTETIDVNISGEWNSNGRVFIRQVDPLPISILAVFPSGYFPIRGQ